MKRTRWQLLMVLLVLVGTQRVYAQATDAARGAQYRDEREQIVKLAKEIPETRGTVFDYGGWFRLTFTKFDDIPSDQEVEDADLRGWGSLSLDDIHQFYARVRVNYAHWSDGTDPAGRRDDVLGPNLELGWYRLRLSEAARKYFNQKLPLEVDLKLGRQYYEIGYGGVLAQILDGVTVDFSHWYFDVRLFAAKTFSSIENLDQSAPKFWHDKRDFFGFQASMKNVLPRHEPYVYGLIVNDQNSYNGAAAGQGFGYDPKYLGIGSHGSLLPGLRYWAEYTLEWGESHTTGSTRNEDIDASAYVAGLEYMCQSFPTHPRFEVEYGVGSGDSDRVSPTMTVFGNTPFTDDDGFLAYGYHDTGVALAARLANLKVLRVTASFKPLEFWERTRQLELGASYYWFDKDRSAGGISDFRADLPSSDVGHELDLFLNWRITSDLLWTVRWGQFSPGKAYTDRSDRDYLLTSITYSF